MQSPLAMLDDFQSLDAGTLISSQTDTTERVKGKKVHSSAPVATYVLAPQ